MSNTVTEDLSAVLQQIDRPGSFCVSGSAPAVLPGLEVEGLGPMALPLTVQQAKELQKHCEQAPYGKGEQTIVDTNVRRVWHLTPEHFALTNPDWEQFLEQTVGKVQEELGLEDRKLEAHLYDLLLYEPGSFFLPHRDGEKLERMVATLVIMLPSSFQGGELVVRHDGQEQTIDFGSGDQNQFRIHFAAFYADCEHEIRPLREGYRLCLVYNLTLTKGKKGLAAPRRGEFVEQVAEVLRDWVKEDMPRKLAVLLEHQYTQEGLTWDALKGVDRAKAQVLLEAADQTDCQAHLALLTFHESGSASYTGGGYGYGYGRRRRWDDEEEDEDEASEYEMEEVFESSLTAEHWSDREGKRLPIGALDVEEDEVVDAESLQEVDPEEEFEGYTGNAGMTLDRWYRHGAIFLWPTRRHFAILCEAGSVSAVGALEQMVGQWQKSGKKDASVREECITFANLILAGWRENPYGGGFMREAKPCPLLPSLAALDEPRLIRAYLSEVLPKDASVDPGKALVRVCATDGWATYQPELEAVFKSTTLATLERTVRLLEEICLANPRKKEGWIDLCEALGEAAVQALERIDQEAAHDWRARELKRVPVLAGLARALLATGQDKLLARVVEHALARPEKYPLTAAHVSALKTLQPWLQKNVKKPSPSLARWLAAGCEQLKTLTARKPEPPADFRRPATISCRCADCAALKRFLDDPNESMHRFTAAQDRRSHLENVIQGAPCALDLKTETRGRPYTLVCTKNMASYQARLNKYHQDQEHLATLRSIQASLPK